MDAVVAVVHVPLVKRVLDNNASVFLIVLARIAAVMGVVESVVPAINLLFALLVFARVLPSALVELRDLMDVAALALSTVLVVQFPAKVCSPICVPAMVLVTATILLRVCVIVPLVLLAVLVETVEQWMDISLVAQCVSTPVVMVLAPRAKYLPLPILMEHSNSPRISTMLAMLLLKLVLGVLTLVLGYRLSLTFVLFPVVNQLPL